MSKKLDSVIEKLRKSDTSSKFIPATEKEKEKFKKIADRYNLPEVIKDFYIKYNPKEFTPIDMDYLCFLGMFCFEEISTLNSVQKYFISTIDKKEWKDSFFVIGGENGDYYFVDTSDNDCPVYVQFHDNPELPNIVLVAKSFIGFLEFLVSYFEFVKKKAIFFEEQDAYCLDKKSIRSLIDQLSKTEITKEYIEIIKLFAESCLLDESKYADEPLTELRWERDEEGGVTDKQFAFNLPEDWELSTKDNSINKGVQNKIQLSFGDLCVVFQDDDIGEYYKLLLDTVLLNDINDFDKDFVRFDHFNNENIEGGKHIYVITSRTLDGDNISGVVFIPMKKGKHIQVSFDMTHEEYDSGTLDTVLNSMKSLDE